MQATSATSTCFKYLMVAFFAWNALAIAEASDNVLRIGVAERDISPQEPVVAFGYGYHRPTEKVDSKLKATAIAIGDSAALKLVIVGVDTAFVPPALIETISNALTQSGTLKHEQLMVVPSHTHSAPMLPMDFWSTRSWMPALSPAAQTAMARYGDLFRNSVVEVVREAVEKMTPSLLEYDRGSARFAIKDRKSVV